MDSTATVVGGTLRTRYWTLNGRSSSAAKDQLGPNPIEHHLSGMWHNFTMYI